MSHASPCCHAARTFCSLLFAPLKVHRLFVCPHSPGREASSVRPFLVVVPLSTLQNWEREFAAWAPHLNEVTFIGNQAARDTIKQHELYAPPGKGGSGGKGRKADLQVLRHQAGRVCRLGNQCDKPMRGIMQPLV